MRFDVGAHDADGPGDGWLCGSASPIRMIHDSLLFAVSPKQSGRVPNPRFAGGHVLCDDRAHADHRALPNRYALLEAGSGADISPVSNRDVAVAVHAGGECDEVADHAVMCNLAIDVGVEVISDAGAASDHRVRTENSAATDLDIVASDYT